MPKISEMTLEELQDYALKLEGQISSKDDELKNKDASISELQTLNTTLQKRNNELFLQVEQQTIPGNDPDIDKDEPAVQTCEELAKSTFMEVIK